MDLVNTEAIRKISKVTSPKKFNFTTTFGVASNNLPIKGKTRSHLISLYYGLNIDNHGQPNFAGSECVESAN